MSKSNETWFCAEGRQDGRPVLIRGRQKIDEIAEAGSHPKLLRIVWRYEVVDPSGLPSSHLSAEMADFEDTVFSTLQKDGLCIFFCVYVHNGIREWLAYTSDLQATCDRFNAALAGREPYPVQLMAENDPDWQEYQSLMRETGASDS